MLRAIHLFPDFESCLDLAAFRQTYDPLADCIPPHVTLVFPFHSAITDAVLIDHVSGICQGAKPFYLGFGPPEPQADGTIWLPVTTGLNEVILLHEKLYTGPLLSYLKRDLQFQPHVTVARLRREELAAAFAIAQSLDCIPDKAIWEVTIERIGPDERSEVITRVALGGGPILNT